MLSKSISSSSTSICFIFFVLVDLSFAGAQTLNYKISHCSNRTFAPNSTFERNLKNLLSDLASHGSDAAGFFAGNASGEVHGLFLCRGDLPAATCRACVSSAAVNITVKCPGDREAIIWYDECMLRISDKYAFSPAEISPAYPFANRENAADPEAFARELNETFADLVLNIDENRSAAGKMYAAREASGGVGEQNHKLYGFAQCVPAMAVTDCRSCIRLAISLIPGCCSGKIGGKVRLPNCDIRFEIYKFFITRNATTTAPPAKTKKIKVVTIVGIVAPIVASVILLAVACRLAIQRRREQGKSNKGDEENDCQEDDSHQTKDNDIATIESLQFDLSTIIAATDNFSDHNKLGEGGFGAVYKGTLCNGKEIAAKRLSSSSKQGVEEFRNEIELVAKLQHRNLVSLLGICFQGEEKILVYEFVPNRSLDYLIFDEEKSIQLDWSSRYKVIEGIARGLLYLHEDSRLRIVHRDLKASNVLLDEDMIPKISDFGLARIFGGDETQGNTCRIVGTHGYMSPEYIMYGHFSTKSDVFSFGILVLEIISGMHNRLSYQPGTGEGLLHCAWRYWTNRTPLELLDPSLRESCSIDELSRCIHIGLLCVQEDMEDRPSMASVLLMLNGSSVCQKLPRQPAFISQRMRQLSFPRSRDSGGHTSSESVPLALSDQVSEDHY